MEDINFEVLHDELDKETLLDFFKQEGIKDIDYLKNDYFKSDSPCDICDCKGNYKTNFDYMYKYNSETNRLVKCEDTDEDAIYDFVFYVCEGCNKASYFIITEP